MDQIKKLETLIAKWLKPFPDMPLTVRKWLAENVWWLAIISLIASIFTAITLFFSIVAYSAEAATYVAFSAIVPNLHYSSTWLTNVCVDFVIVILTIVITSTAIKPLRQLRYRGWFLLFLLLMLSAIHIILGAILSLNIGVFLLDLVTGAIGFLIASYLLFQIRGQFDVSLSRKAHKATIVRDSTT